MGEKNDKVRVAFLFYVDPNLVKFTGGGLAKYIVFHLLSRDNYFKVYVITTNYFRSKGCYELLPIKILNTRRAIINFILWIIASTYLLIKLVKKYRVRILVGGGPSSPVTLVPVYLVKRIMSRNVTTLSFCQLPILSKRQKIYAQMLKSMDAIIASTSIVKRSIIKVRIRKPIFVTGYGILKPSKIPSTEVKDLDCVVLGRVTREKGSLDLIKILEIVKRMKPDVKCVVIGEVLDENIVSLAKRSHLPITFLGFVEHEKIWEYLARSKIMIYPSRYDSFAIAVAEAMMAGLPVITWNIPPFNEEYKGSGIVLVKPFNHEAFAKEIINLLDDNEKRKTLGAKNKDFVKKFSWGNVYKRFKRAVLATYLKHHREDDAR